MKNKMSSTPSNRRKSDENRPTQLSHVEHPFGWPSTQKTSKEYTSQDGASGALNPHSVRSRVLRTPFVLSEDERSEFRLSDPLRKLMQNDSIMEDDMYPGSDYTSKEQKIVSEGSTSKHLFSSSGREVDIQHENNVTTKKPAVMSTTNGHQPKHRTKSKKSLSNKISSPHPPFKRRTKSKKSSSDLQTRTNTVKIANIPAHSGPLQCRFGFPLVPAELWAEEDLGSKASVPVDHSGQPEHVLFSPAFCDPAQSETSIPCTQAPLEVLDLVESKPEERPGPALPAVPDNSIAPSIPDRVYSQISQEMIDIADKLQLTFQRYNKLRKVNEHATIVPSRFSPLRGAFHAGFWNTALAKYLGGLGIGKKTCKRIRKRNYLSLMYDRPYVILPTDSSPYRDHPRALMMQSDV